MSPAVSGRDRRLGVLLVATALCYAVGYPLALVAHWTVGWVLVTLGGPLLIALGFVVISRVNASSRPPSSSADQRPEPPRP